MNDFLADTAMGKDVKVNERILSERGMRERKGSTLKLTVR